MSGVLFTISFHITCTHNVRITSAFHKCNTISSLYPCYLHFDICPYPNVSYDTLTTREGAARQDSSGAAAAQEVGTVGTAQETDLISDPYLEIPNLDLLGSLFKVCGKEGLTAIHTKKEKGLLS